MRIIGIDLSLTETGICCLRVADRSNGDGTDADLHIIKEPKLREAQRLLALRRHLRDIIDVFKPDLAIVEGYAYEGIGRLAELGEWGGVIKVELEERSIPFIVVAPKRLKKFAAGNGDATKEQMIEAVEKRYGVCTDNDNLADAVGLSKVGEIFVTGKSIFRSELEVVRDLKNELRGDKKTYAKYEVLRGVL